MRFEEYYKRRLDEDKAGPHKPARSNVAYELGVAAATGTLAGSKIQGKNIIVQKLRPVVMDAFRIFRRKGFHPQDIEEMLLDSLRLAILYTSAEGGIRGGYKSSMPVAEFMRRSKKKHAGYKSLDKDEDTPEEPEPDLE